MSQSLVLEVVEGPLQGETYGVTPDDTFLVGRLPECNLTIPQDLTVSRQQFRIEFRPPECRLVHLSQTSETRVNDAAVTSINLADGDVISFGSGNLLRVRLEKVTARTAAVKQSGRINPATLQPQGAFLTATSSSGWTLYHSDNGELDFERVLTALSQSQPVFAVIDFKRLGQPVPDQLVDADYLFLWFPPEIRLQFSPVLVPLSSNPKLIESLRSYWGRDGLICCGSSLKQPELLAHWRKSVGVRDDGPGTAMTLYYWPSLFSQMLECQTAEQLSGVKSGLSWVLMEAPKSPGQWKLYADEDFANKLTSAGLVQAKSADPSTSAAQQTINS